MENIMISGKYVKSKISKVKWLPHDSISGEPRSFITGSYDDTLGEICIYNVEIDGEVQKVFSLNQLGDVTALVSLNDNDILTASSNGDVNLFNYNHELQSLSLSHNQSSLHQNIDHSTSACNALTTNQSGQVASVGDDGVLNVMQAEDSLTVVSSFETGDGNDINFLTQSTIATVNSAAQLKLYDIRVRHTKFPKPQLQLSLPQLETLHCIEQQQPHIVLVAGSSGCLHCFDTRGTSTAPLVSYRGHTSHVWQMKSHPSGNIFSCSQDGSLLHRPVHPSLIPTESWDESSRMKASATDLMPDNNDSINCLDVVGNSLVAGLSSHQIITFTNLHLS